MKDYKRLTDKYYPCVVCKNGKCLEQQYDCEEREVCEAWNRLFQLENKIESGELCDREEVRKETAKEIAERVKMAFYYEFDELIPSIMADKIDELVKEICGDD